MKLNRDISRVECHWLDRDLKADTVVYPYHGYTYGCVSPSGTAVSLTAPNEDPFVEIPTDALDEVD